MKVVGIYGGNLGKYDPVKNEAKEYPYNDDGTVTVPDGWIDGNGKYRGMGYQVSEGTPLASKLVNKINYASSMQSHLTGANNLYNDLHKEVVGKNSLLNSSCVKIYGTILFLLPRRRASKPCL